MLSKKLFRTILRYKVQFISMIVMIALGTGLFVCFNMEWKTIEDNSQNAFEETGFADYRLVDQHGFTQEDLDSISNIEGINQSARFLSVNSVAKSDGDTITIAITTNPKVSGFVVTSGSNYDASSTNGIWLSDRYAERHNISVGDAFTVTYQGTDISGEVKGLIKSGEYLIYLPNSSQMVPDYDTSGYMYISPAMLSAKVGYEYYNQINVLTDLDKDTFSQKANVALDRTVVTVPKQDTVSYSQTQVQITQGQMYASLFPVLFMIITILIMMTTMHRITTNEKIQIGTLKALGFRNSKLKIHYTLLAVIVGIAGVLVGFLLGYFLVGTMIGPGSAVWSYIDLPTWEVGLPVYTFAILALIVLIMVAVGYLSVRMVLRGNTADALKPYVPKKMKSLYIERTNLWNKLGFGMKWNIRDVMRHKSRTAMTIIGVLGCVLLLVSSMGIRDSANSYVDKAYGEGINYETDVVISINATNNETIVYCEAHQGDWAAKSSVMLLGETVSLEIYNVTRDHIRFFDNSMNRMELGDDGAYICERIAREKGLSAGDNITFSPYGTDIEYTVKIAGVINSMTKAIVMTSKMADSNGIDYKINNVYTNDKNIPLTSIVESTITKDAMVKAFDNYMATLNLLITILIVTAIVLGIVVLYNLGTMSYIERTREMATLKVLGFRNAQIGKILIGQNLWTTVVGIIIGVPLGVFVLKYFMDLLLYQYEMVMNISIVTYIVAIVSTLVISLAIGLLIVRNNKKIDMVSSLKGME